MVIDEGVLFRNSETVFVQKKVALSECDLWCIVSLPQSVFVNAGASSKTNLLFFTKGQTAAYNDPTNIGVKVKALW